MAVTFKCTTIILTRNKNERPKKKTKKLFERIRQTKTKQNHPHIFQRWNNKFKWASVHMGIMQLNRNI